MRVTRLSKEGYALLRGLHNEGIEKTPKELVTRIKNLQKKVNEHGRCKICNFKGETLFELCPNCFEQIHTEKMNEILYGN